MNDIKILFVDDADPISSSPFREVELNYTLKYLPNTQYLLYKNSNIINNTLINSKNYNLGYSIGLIGSVPIVRNIFEKINLPFCFELYPGFGFSIDNNHNSFYNMSYLFNHPLFKGVIVTMPHTLRFIKNKNLVPEEKIHFKYGGFIDCNNTPLNPPKKKPDIFFIAHNYGGVSSKIKGFDIFQEASKKFPEYNFIAYGDWKCSIQNNLKINSPKPIKEIIKEISLGDILISYNRFSQGMLDGFPTSCAVEAGLAGAALLLSDLGDNNVFLEDDIDFIKIKENNYLSKLDYILKKGDLRESIGLNGSNKFKIIFDCEDQIKSRIDFYKKII